MQKNATEPDPEPMELQLIPTPVNVKGGSDGASDLTVSSGTNPYHYQWSNGETTEDIDNLIAFNDERQLQMYQAVNRKQKK